jgi:AraC-like DNA-binding protein
MPETFYNPPLYRAAPKGGKHGSPRMRLRRPAPCELSYLSWGSRHYGEPALEPRKPDGWHYFMVLAHRPTLIVGGREIVTWPGMINIADPDCTIGHRDEPGAVCQMLTWIWRTAPSHSALRPENGGSLRLTLAPEQIRRLNRLHIQCRKAAMESDERGELRLRSNRLLVDLCLLEACEPQRTPDARIQVGIAIEYLLSHFKHQDPIQDLCDYLRVSKSSLCRLFNRYTGKSPRTYAHELRMQWARDRLLGSHESVKSVAYSLGYLHVPDFSRAVKQHFGVPASSLEE